MAVDRSVFAKISSPQASIAVRPARTRIKPNRWIIFTPDTRKEPLVFRKPKFYVVSAEKIEREERTGKSQFALLSATFGQFTKTA